MDMIDGILAFDRWATTELLDACESLTGAQLDQDFDFGVRTLRESFEHLLFNMEAWTLLAQQVPVVPIRGDHSVADFEERHAAIQSRFADFARTARDAGRLDDTFIDHYGGTMSLGGVVIHVAMHNVEHRADILHMLARLGVRNAGGGPIEIDHALWDQSAKLATS